MATILTFVPRAARTSPRKQRGDASIIIFPGVRYERVPKTSLIGSRVPVIKRHKEEA